MDMVIVSCESAAFDFDFEVESDCDIVLLFDRGLEDVTEQWQSNLRWQ